MSAVLSVGDVERFRDGNPDAVRAVYREYGRLVYAVACRQLGSTSLAEEVTQQTFLRAWQAANSFDTARDLAPWLATIARRCAIDVHRREQRRPQTQGLASVGTDLALATTDPGIERSVDIWAVRQAIDELPDDERAIVRLQHLDGFTHPEIAEHLNLPVGTVKSRSFRAHRRLAAALGHLRDTAQPTRTDPPPAAYTPDKQAPRQAPDTGPNQ